MADKPYVTGCLHGRKRLPDSMSGSLYFKHFRKLGDLGHTGYNFVHKLTGIIAKDTRILKLVHLC